MFSHITIGANDMEKAKAFYDATLGALGVPPGVADSQGRTIYANGGAVLVITRPINGDPACHANGGTVGFAAGSAAQVDDWHAAGIVAGGASCEDPPGVRESEMGPLHLAYLRDPDGNKLCALHRIG